MCSNNLINWYLPDRSLLSMRFRSASTQNSLPSLLSRAKATGRISPVVKRDSRSVPSKDAPCILAERSCIVVKYMYLSERRHLRVKYFPSKKNTTLHGIKIFKCTTIWAGCSGKHALVVANIFDIFLSFICFDCVWETLYIFTHRKSCLVLICYVCGQFVINLQGGFASLFSVNVWETHYLHLLAILYRATISTSLPIHRMRVRNWMKYYNNRSGHFKNNPATPMGEI